MSSYRELLEEGKSFLREQGIGEADLDAWLLLEDLIEQDRSWYFLHMEDTAEARIEDAYRQILVKRGAHIPLQQITGKAWFMGLCFCVNEHVLIPRQDTEILVEQALMRLRQDDRVLDLCTGSGCILLSLLYNNSRAKGVGVDISQTALKVARENQKRLRLLGAEFLQGDLYEPVEGQFHMIVTNPPYIPPSVIEGLMEEVRDHEPRLALDGGEDGLDFYRRIIGDAGQYLYSKGWLLMEIGWEQASAVTELLREEKFEEIEVVKDLAGLDRVVIGRVL